MNTVGKVRRLTARRRWLTVTGLILILGLPVRADDRRLELVKTRTAVFTNVTVTGMSKTDIFIRHSSGIGNVKIADLQPETLQELGLGPPPPKEKPFSAVSSLPKVNLERVVAMPAELNKSLPPSLSAILSSIHPTPNLVTLAAVLVLGGYLFFSHCFKLICEKTGQQPGALIWVPGLQMLPLLRAAGMSGWWFVGFFIPGINLIAAIMWPFKIVQARGKSALVALSLLFPFANLFALVYLAYSDGEEATEKPALQMGKRSAALGEA